MKLTSKQKRFCEEYIVDCNATQAAIRAGYSKKTANEQGARLLAKVSINEYINELLEKVKNNKIADATEVMEYLTSVMRGESESEIVVVEGVGDGCSVARVIQKKPDEKDKLKSAELLGKRFGLFKDKMEVEGVAKVIFEDDLGDTDD